MTDNSLYFKNSMAGLIVIALIIFSAKTFFIGSPSSGRIDNSTLEERIQPIGQVYLEGEIDVAAIAVVKPKMAVKKSRSGVENLFTPPLAQVVIALVLLVRQNLAIKRIGHQDSSVAWRT